MFKTYFLDVITKHYIDFQGEATRKQFWLFVLFNFIISTVLTILGVVGGDTIGDLFSALNILFSLAIFIPGLAIAVRRLHDIGRSGWWLLISLVPFIGGIVLLVFYVLPSKR